MLQRPFSCSGGMLIRCRAYCAAFHVEGVIGMKILGQGDLSGSVEAAIGHATRLDCIDGFTIGFRSAAELDDVQSKIEAA